MEFSMRAKAEGLSITVKTVLVYLLVFKGWGLLAYAVSQVAYSLMLLAAYILLNKEEGVSYNTMLRKSYSLCSLSSGGAKGWADYVLPQHSEDLRGFTQVCILKFLLTEGEKIVIFYFTSGQDKDNQETIR